MEKIISIEEVTFNGVTEYGNVQFDGVKLQTENSVYEVGIDNYSQCCENWGYIFNEDGDAQSFIGSNLLNVDCDGTFTRFFTDRGVLEFTSYNEHDGYYSHFTILKKNGTTINQSSI